MVRSPLSSLSIHCLGPNELSIRDATALNALLGPSGAPKGPRTSCIHPLPFPPFADFVSGSADFIGRVLSDETLPMVGILDTDAHLRRRKNWGRGMGPAAIKEYEHFIARRARQLLERLERRVGEVLVIGNWFNYFTCVFEDLRV